MPSAQADEPVVVILGSHPFPHGNASANRMLTMAMTWKAAGWRCLVLNDYPSEAADGTSLDVRSVAGINYMNVGERSQSRFQRLRQRRSLPGRVASTVDRLGLSTAVSHLVFPSMMYSPRSVKLLARALPRAKTVVDVVERHDLTQFSGFVLHPYYLRHRLTSWFAARRAGKVIVISTALASGPFAAARPFILPPCVDVAEFQAAADEVRGDSVTRVTYFGSPGNKDDLSALLRAVPQLTDGDRSALKITLAGLNEHDLLGLPGMEPGTVDAARDVLDVAGRLNRTEVIALLGRSHYSFLLRDPNAQFARFGFPSKVPESLAAGCPLIGNLTSDLRSYVADGRNAIVCGDATAGDVATALTRAIESVRDGSYSRLSQQARITAERQLAPSSWAVDLRTWLLS